MRVLLVDDDALVAEVIAAVLEDQGAEVFVCSDAREALTLNRGRFDLIISDMKMPEISGLDLCRQLRADGDKTPFILLSGENHDDFGSGIRPDACVVKGLNLQGSLLSTISGLLPGRSIRQ